MLRRTIIHDGCAALGDNLAIMKTLVALFCLSLPLAAFADADVADGALRPTRMQMCQHELKDVPEAQRKTQFNTCLQRRAKAEVAMERDCRRESQAIKGAKPRETDELRRNAMRNCMNQGLARPYAELPGGGVRKTADAKSSKPAAAKVVPTSNKPGAADAGKGTGKPSSKALAPSDGKPKLMKTSAPASGESSAR